MTGQLSNFQTFNLSTGKEMSDQTQTQVPGQQPGQQPGTQPGQQPGQKPGQQRQYAQRAAQARQRVRSLEEAHIDDLLRLVVEWKGSDLHMTVGVPPVIRVDGHLHPTPYERVQPQDNQRILYDILSDEQIQRFEQNLELDFSYQVPRDRKSVV